LGLCRHSRGSGKNKGEERGAAGKRGYPAAAVAFRSKNRGAGHASLGASALLKPHRRSL